MIQGVKYSPTKLCALVNNLMWVRFSLFLIDFVSVRIVLTYKLFKGVIYQQNWYHPSRLRESIFYQVITNSQLLPPPITCTHHFQNFLFFRKAYTFPLLTENIFRKYFNWWDEVSITIFKVQSKGISQISSGQV